MKKILFVIMALGLLIAAPAAAQNKALDKALKKELAAKKKDFKKGGWEIFGTSRSLDVALLKHYQALEEGGEGVFEIIGYGQGKSKNILATAAQNSAANRYAAEANARIKAQIKTTLEGNANEVSEEVDKFSAIYLSKVEAEIKGQLKASFSIIRTNPQTGVSELQTYFIVNEATASRARQAAYDAAVGESSLSADIANKAAAAIADRVVPAE